MTVLLPYFILLSGGLIVLAMLSFIGHKATKPRVRPPCFGSDPGPQERAENDCVDCRSDRACLG